MIAVGVLGSTGRMGQAILAILQDNPSCQLSLAGTRDNLESLFQTSDVVIDFTTPEAFTPHVELGLTHKKPLVVGTTGLQPSHHLLASQAATQIPLVIASNMSIGMTLLADLVQKSAHFLSEDFDIEVRELHHRAKKDAPSGSSLFLGQAAALGRGKTLEELRCPDSRQGPRPSGTIGFCAQRGGAIIGDHTVSFIGDHEMIELSHRGLSRTLYAKGALHAAQWIISQNPGVYSMADVLSL
jgi:4-hydroxy-tetrahydrodipicolinate reductase